MVSLGALLVALALADTSAGAAADSVAPAPAAAAAADSVATAPADTAAVPRFGGHNLPAWPVYVRWNGEGGRSLRVFGPVTAASRAPGYGAFYLVAPLTGVRRWDDGRRDWRLLWPLTHARVEPARGRWSADLATPLLGLRSIRTPEERSFAFFPLYSDQWLASGTRKFSFVPFYRREESPQAGRLDETFGVAPMPGFARPWFWLYRGWLAPGGRGWNAAMAFGGWECDSARLLHLGPWLSYDRPGAGGAFTRFRGLLPLYARYQASDERGEARDVTSALLLHASGRHVTPGGAVTRFSFTLPVHASYRRDESGRETRLDCVLPFYGYLRRPDWDVRAGLPSWWSYRSANASSHGLWPLYASFSSREAGGGTRTGGSFAWPLVAWGSGEAYRTLGILPLYYRLRDGDRTILAVPPVYWSLHKPGHEQRLLLPIHGRFVGPGDSTTVVLNYYRRTKPGYASTGLFPFYERAVAGDSGRSFAVPLWYHSWNPGYEAWLAAPAWFSWRSKVDSGYVKLLGPVVWSRSRGTSRLGILPVYYSCRGPEIRRTLVGPVFTSESARGARHVVVAPLAWYRRDPAGWAVDLLPLSGYRARADGGSLLYVLGPVYRRRVESPSERTSSLLGWLYRDETRGERRRSMFQPLYYYEREAKEKVFVSALGGLLFSYERSGRARELRLLFVPVRRWSR